MRGSPLTFWIWLGLTLADDHATDVLKLGEVPNIKRIPLYANLQAIGIDPDVSGEVYSMKGDGIPPLPVGLDFQLLSVNGGM